MTLRRVERITVENWRNWQGEMTIDDLPTGVVVLAGPNAVGKTGLWEAVVGGLLDRHWGTHTSRVRPAGTKGVIPRVQLDFNAADQRYRVEKSFGSARDKASFLKWSGHEWVLQDEGEEAYLLCRRAVLGGAVDAPSRGGPEKALQDTLMEVLLPPQGGLTSRAPTPEAVSMSVTDRDAATAATRVGRVLAAVSAEADQVWVPKRGKVRTGSQLQQDEERLAGIEEEIVPLMTDAARIGELVHELSDTTESASGHTDVAAQAARVDLLRREAAEHREQREAAKEKFAGAERVRDEITTKVRERATAEKTAEDARASAAGCRQELQAAGRLREQAEQNHTELKTRREDLARGVRRYREWIEYESRESELEELRKALTGVLERVKLVKSLEDEIDARTAEAKDLKLPEKKGWAQIDRLRERLQEARGELNAGAWAASGAVPEGLTLRIDGEPIDAAEVEARVTRLAEVEGSDGRTLRFTAPTRSGEEVDRLKAELGAIFESYGVADHKELRSRYNYLEAEVKGAILTAKSRLADALGDGDKTDLLTAKLKIEDRIARKSNLTKPATTRPDGVPEEWKIRLGMLEEDQQKAGLEIERDGPALGALVARAEKAGQALDDAVQNLQLAEESLAAHRERHGPTEELNLAMVRAEAAAGELQAAWSRLDDARPMAEQAKEERADKLSAGLKEVLETRDRIQQLSAGIEALRRADPEGALARLEAEKAGLVKRIRSARTHADALLLLERSLSEEKDRVTSAIGEPVREKLQAWVTYLLQDESEVVVNEEGHPAVIRTPAGREIPYEDQSFGTREQISILHRLAVADLVSEEAGAGVVLMLDDPFGHTDRGRRERILDILSAEAAKRGHQILIFTCRPEDFEGVGTHVTVARSGPVKQ